MSTIQPQRLSVQGIQQYEEAHRETSRINVGKAERWASAIGGTLLVTHGLRTRSFSGIALAMIGGSLLYRGVTGHCQAYEALHMDTSDKHRSDAEEHIHDGRLIKQTTTINRPAGELYAYWRNVENAPHFMTNIESVQTTGEGTSHWVANAPFGQTFSWDSQIINDDPGRLIAWKSLPGSDIHQAGTVRFEQASGTRGTVVTVEQNFEIPAGFFGLTIAKILGQDPDTQVRENLRHFKQLMETGEIPTTAGQSSGRAS